MDELSDYTSTVIEFAASNKKDQQCKLIDSGTATDLLPLKIDAILETDTKCSQQTQTEPYQTLAKNVDERKLANWLHKIYSNVEKELLKGCTPILESFSNKLTSADIIVQPYQKLSVPAAANSQGLAIWLSVHTNNAPVLVVTTVAAHDDWCEHVDQGLKLFVPKRVPNGNFVTYNEEKNLPIKACLRCLCTNPFNKNIFAGSSFDGDLYVWQYEEYYRSHTSNRNNIDIKAIYHTTMTNGYAVALDWSSEFTLLTAHSNCSVVQWQLGEAIIQEAEYLIKAPLNASAEICTLLASNLNSFVVGTKDGSVFHCTISSVSIGKRQVEIVSLKKHLFMTSTLLLSHVNGHKIVISCDMSGQVYFHDLRNLSDDTNTIVTQIPLPFKNTIACSRDGSIIFSPGDDGSLNCYRCWVVTGLYENAFQIFSIES